MSRVAHPAGPRHGDVLPADHPPVPAGDLNALHPGIWPRGARRSGGVLTLRGSDVRDLAAEFGTPLYVCDEADVRSRCREYIDAFGPAARVFYAAKAFCSRAVLRWVSAEGLGVDVCTGGELAVALSAGVPPEQITMHGNNKSQDELADAISAGVGHIVADSFEEIARLAYLTRAGDPPAERPAARPKVLVRVTTGVEAHTHEFMATAHDDQKFGFSLSSGAADEAVRRVIACPGLDFAGLHSHIGSQIFDAAGFEVAAHRVIELAVRIRDEHGIEIAELDLGGGFGIAYTEEDDPPEVKELAQSLRQIVDGQCRATGLTPPRLTVEPGRAIVGPSMVTLYTVGTIKDRGRAADLRQRGRRDERQHQDRPVRRLLHRRAGLPRVRRPADADPGGGPALRERRHRGPARLAAHPTWPPATCWPSPPPAPTAGPWPATTTTSRVRP